LFPVYVTIMQWGNEWTGLPAPPVDLLHKPCGHRTTARVVCGECGAEMTDTPAASIPLNLADVGAFLAASGLRLTEVTGQSVTGTLKLGPQHHTPWGIVHGGVYTTAIESAASAGATAAVAERGQFAVGVHKSDFLRSTKSATATLHATPVHQGRTQQLWDVTITDQDGHQLARGALRLQNVDARR
jgi:1,4-dihydroxy-2-naphthoyl-CoA hydrolase